jgi:hypothetical protein
VTTKELREELGWDQSMAYKYVQASVKHNLIRYRPGTTERNVKPLLPVSGTSGTFLPSPRQVLDNAEELDDAMDYVSPLRGKVTRVLRSKKPAA